MLWAPAEFKGKSVWVELNESGEMVAVDKGAAGIAQSGLDVINPENPH